MPTTFHFAYSVERRSPLVTTTFTDEEAFEALRRCAATQGAALFNLTCDDAIYYKETGGKYAGNVYLISLQG